MYWRIRARDDEDAKDAVDDAWNGAHEDDEEFEGVRKTPRGAFPQEKWRRPMPRRYGDEQRDRAGNQGAVNEGQRATLTRKGVPYGGRKNNLKTNLWRGARSLATITKTSNKGDQTRRRRRTER